MRDYMTVEDGIVFAGNRLVVPMAFRKEYLDRVHAGHQGITKCQLRAKECIYWPNMLADIDEMVSDCMVCLKSAKSLQKEPMISHELPGQPWEVLSSDLFEIDGHTYILLIDHFSKMPLVRGLRSVTSAEVIKFMKDIFSVHGVPVRLYTDNGPQYDAAVFRNFALEWEFEHITSSPRYPQSNGIIERSVQTVKAVLKKAKQSGTDPHLALLCLRSTPLSAKTASPAELLYHRKIRSNLPAKNTYSQENADHKAWLESNSQKQAEHYNKTAGCELPELLPGMKVMMQQPDKQSWVPGTITDKCQEPRSYLVQSPNGNVLRRNRRFLKELSRKASTQLSVRPQTAETLVEEIPPQPDPPSVENIPLVDTAGKKVSFDIEGRKSSRNRKQPSRLIEECAVMVHL